VDAQALPSNKQLPCCIVHSGRWLSPIKSDVDSYFMPSGWSRGPNFVGVSLSNVYTACFFPTIVRYTDFTPTSRARMALGSPVLLPARAGLTLVSWLSISVTGSHLADLHSIHQFWASTMMCPSISKTFFGGFLGITECQRRR
jgi:hypothetical protein